MDISFEIIKISPRIEETIDYNTLIFKINIPKKMSVETSRDYWVFCHTLINGGVQKIIADFKGTDYIDSSGIGILIKAAKQIKAKKGDIFITGVSAEIKDIFKMINLQNFITVYNSEVEAVNSFRYISG